MKVEVGDFPFFFESHRVRQQCAGLSLFLITFPQGSRLTASCDFLACIHPVNMLVRRLAASQLCQMNIRK